MRHRVYFLISPKPELRDLVLQDDMEAIAELAEPTLWAGGESDRGGLRGADTDGLVKLLYVDMLIREHPNETAFQKIFGRISPSLAFFDMHWTLSRVPLDMTTEGALTDSLHAGTVVSMMPSGRSEIDSTLAEYQARFLSGNYKEFE